MARWLRSWRASGSASAVAGFGAGCILSVQHNGAWRRHAPVAWSALGENQSDGACEGVASWLRRRAGASRAAWKPGLPRRRRVRGAPPAATQSRLPTRRNLFGALQSRRFALALCRTHRTAFMSRCKRRRTARLCAAEAVWDTL